MRLALPGLCTSPYGGGEGCSSTNLGGSGVGCRFRILLLRVQVASMRTTSCELPSVAKSLGINAAILYAPLELAPENGVGGNDYSEYLYIPDGPGPSSLLGRVCHPRAVTSHQILDPCQMLNLRRLANY